MTQTLERGEKVAQLRAAIREFGKDCTYHHMKRHIQQKYGWEVPESTFYTERKAYRLESQNKESSEDTNMATPTTPAPTTSSPARNGPATVVAPPEATTAPETIATALPEERSEEIAQDEDNGVIALVKAGKLLIEKMGSKEKARQLIDML